MLDTNKKITFIKNNDFKTILLELFIPYTYKSEEEIISSILCSLLLNKSRNYPNEEDMNQEMLKKNILCMNISNKCVGKTNFFTVRFMVPDTTLLSIPEIKDAFAFLMDALYDPYVEDDGFDASLLERKKRELHTYIANSNQNIGSLSSRHAMKLVDTDGFMTDDIFKHEDEIDPLTGKQIYTYYQEKIASVRPFFFLFGREDTAFLLTFLEEEMQKRKLKPIQMEENYTCFLKKANLPNIECVENFPFEQSYLIFSYKVEDMKEEDRKVLGVFSSLLSSQSSSLLSKALRDEEGLVYSTSSYAYTRSGMFWIQAKIHRDSYEKAKEKIVELMEKMKEESFLTPFLEKIKERRRMELSRLLDSKFSLLGDAIDVGLGYDVSMEEEYQIIKNLEAKDIAHMANRLTLELIYLGRGTRDEKDNT